MSGWTAIVLAGSRPGRDPLADAFGTDLKALIPVAGTPMVRRPVEALLGSDWIGRVLVVAQQPDRIAEALPSDSRLSVSASGETIASTIQSVCSDRSLQWPVLITTADHALLDGKMIDEFCRRSSRSDISIGLVERKRFRRRFPDNRRTWIKFRGGAYSGANLFQLRSTRSLAAIELWRSVEQDRKKGWRLLLALGPVVMLGAILRLLTLEAVMHRVSTRLGLAIRAVALRNPLAAVDVDKPSDHRLVETILQDAS